LYDYHPDITTSKSPRFTPTVPRLPVQKIIGGAPRELETEVLIIGSGAGGGVMASELVKAGIKVVVLEKGGYYRADDFKKWRENEAPQKLFERQGFLQSKSGSIAVLAGSVVGGGTTLNWMASFRTPRHVLDDWVTEGLSQFAPNGPYCESMDAIHELMNVNTKFSFRSDKAKSAETEASNDDCDESFVVNNNNKALWDGAEACGFHPEKIPRNVRNCVDCGHCGYG
jgi:choline dehydrogenase-like flavoprotein